jgi:hypothetical protein
MRFWRKNAYNGQRFFRFLKRGSTLAYLNALTPNSFFTLDVQKP